MRTPGGTASQQAPAILLAGLGVFWFADTVADPDLWGHVRFGLDCLSTGRLTETDAYSYLTAGRRWINHEWLSEAVLAAVFAQAGTRGLVFLKVLLALGTMGIAFRALCRKGVAPLAAVGLVVLAAVPFRMGMGTIRPQLFTYLAFAVLLRALDRTPCGNERRLGWLPILFAAWVNLHGGVLAGVGVLGIWLGIRLLRRLAVDDRSWSLRARDAAPLVLTGATCLVALGLNPYGPDLLWFLARTATVPRPEIIEWQPLDPGSFPGSLVLALMGITGLGLLASRQRRPAEAVAIVLVTACLTMQSRRHAPLFALAALILTGDHLGDLFGRWRLAIPHGGASRKVVWAASLVALILIARSLPSWRCIRIDAAHFAFPARAVALLRASETQGNLALPFDWGEYAIWHVGPALRVSIDGRRETVYSEPAYRQALDLEQGSGAWDALLKTTRTDLVLLRNLSPTAARLAQAPSWIPLYQDSFCVLFARAGWTGLESVLRTPVPALPDDGDGLCFP